MLGRLPISVSAPFLIGIPVLVVGVWLSVMWNRQSRYAVTQLADQNIEQIHDMAATKVADVLSIPVRICEVNQHLVRSGALDRSDLHSWRPTLVQQAEAFDMLSAITWGGAEGRSAWVSRYADGTYYWAVKNDPADAKMAEWRLDEKGDISSEPSSTFDFDLFSRPWFLAPRKAGKATWSKPYVWLGGVDSEGMTLGISYGIPLYDPDETFLGIVDADFSLNDLSSFLQSISIGKSGVAALTTSAGQLLAVSSDTPIVTSDGQLVRADQSPDPLIVAAANFVGEAESVRATHAEMEVDGAVYYLRASPIGREVGLNWTLVTIVPEKDFTAEIETEFHRSWTASLIAVALAVVVGLAAARWLVTPLITLVAAVRRIGQGDLETRVDIRHAPEYTKLADEINEMTLGLQDRMRMRHSLALAMDVQQALLPSDSPQVKGLDISGHSTYCDETGGDYYDFLDITDLGEQSVCVALGDVMGHGIAAAMLMATARGILRSHSQESRSLAELLNHMNELLVPDTGGERFMTMLLMTLDAQKGVLRWASAGHDPPFIMDPQAGTSDELEGSGLPLGIIAEEQYETYEYTKIRPGQVLFAATDGVWEMQNSQDEQFGKQRIRELLMQCGNQPAEAISQAIRDALNEFRGDSAPDDDVTFVIVVVK